MSDSPDFVPGTVLHPDALVSSLARSTIPAQAQGNAGELTELPLGDKEPRDASENHESALEKEFHTPSSTPPPAKEYYCGVGKLHPRWLQVFRDAKFFTFLLCLDCFIEGALVSGECRFLHNYGSLWPG